MANEVLGASRFLADTLTFDPVLQGLRGDRLYPNQAPEQDPSDPLGGAPAYPFQLYIFQSGRDRRGNGNRRVLVNIRMAVVTIGQLGDPSDIQAIDDQTDALLDPPPGAAPIPPVQQGGVTYRILSCSRVEIIDHARVEDGVLYNWLGGSYQVLVEAVQG